MQVGRSEVSDITFEELSKYFHLTINDAANQLSVCPTMLKKTCRQNGVDRWPYRKIKSIDSLIESLQKLIDDNKGEAPKLNMDMDDLLQKRKFLLENPNVSYKSVVSKYCINSFRAQIQKVKENSSFSERISTPIKKKPVTKYSRPVNNVILNAVDIPVINATTTLLTTEIFSSPINPQQNFDFELQQYINESVQYARILNLGPSKSVLPHHVFLHPLRLSN